jgi:mannosyltransferase
VRLSGERRLLLGALAGIMLAAAGLRLSNLVERSVWFDEACCWRMARFPVREILARAPLDRTPPFYYIVLKAWTACAGESVIALRGLSVLWGVLACIGMYLTAAQTYRMPGVGVRAASARANARWIGLCTAAFIAVSVLHIRWSCEAKMYSQGAALAALSAWSLLRALAAPQPSWRRWFVYIVLAIAFGYTHNYAPFSLLAQGVFAVSWIVVRARRDTGGFYPSSWPLAELVRSKHLHALVLSALLITIAAVAWLPLLAEQLKRTSTHPLAPLRTWSAWSACYQLLIDPQSPFVPRWAADGVSAGTVALLIALVWRPVAGDWFMFFSAAAPPAIAATISHFCAPVFHSHYLQFAQLFLLAGAARILAGIPHKVERSAVAVIIVLNMLMVNHEFWTGLDTAHRPGTSAAAAMINHGRKADSAVVVASPFYFSPILYYLSDRRNCYLFDDGQPLEAWEGPAIVRPGDFIDRRGLESIAGSQIWVVNVHSPGTSWHREPLAAPKNWEVVQRSRFQEIYFVQGSVEVVEFRRQDTALRGAFVAPVARSTK